ncbi:MAG: hypothetical protein D6690_05340 [Nitrospirae bacterium]|nr:MAG: hypothetical protein D6690_05340 [Nitrospirota bacterium]
MFMRSKTKEFFQSIQNYSEKEEKIREFVAKHPHVHEEWKNLRFQSELFRNLEDLLLARNVLHQSIYAHPELAEQYIESLPNSMKSHPVISFMADCLKEIQNSQKHGEDSAVTPLWEWSC